MRLSFDQAAARFSHVDGAISRVQRDPLSAVVEIGVRLYPCWEHPRYADAVLRGARWGFSGTSDSQRDCAVRVTGEPMKPSSNQWDWLGEGISFWEQNPERSLGA